jgi:hypothetical protein
LTYDQPVQVTEHRNGLCDDPGDNPARHTEPDPDSDRAFASAVDQIGLVAKTEIDVLETNVAVDHTSSNNLIVS